MGVSVTGTFHSGPPNRIDTPMSTMNEPAPTLAARDDQRAVLNSKSVTEKGGIPSAPTQITRNIKTSSACRSNIMTTKGVGPANAAADGHSAEEGSISSEPKLGVESITPCCRHCSTNRNNFRDGFTPPTKTRAAVTQGSRVDSNKLLYPNMMYGGGISNQGLQLRSANGGGNSKDEEVQPRRYPYLTETLKFRDDRKAEETLRRIHGLNDISINERAREVRMRILQSLLKLNADFGNILASMQRELDLETSRLNQDLKLGGIHPTMRQNQESWPCYQGTGSICANPYAWNQVGETGACQMKGTMNVNPANEQNTRESNQEHHARFPQHYEGSSFNRKNLQVSDGRQPTNVLKDCQACSTTHQSNRNCLDFMDRPAQQRFQVVKGLRLCYKCIKSGHLAKDCAAPACQKDGCGRLHHQSLHIDHPTEQILNAQASCGERHQSSECVNPPGTKSSKTKIEHLTTNKVSAKANRRRNVQCNHVVIERSQVLVNMEGVRFDSLTASVNEAMTTFPPIEPNVMAPTDLEERYFSLLSNLGVAVVLPATMNEEIALRDEESSTVESVDGTLIQTYKRLNGQIFGWQSPIQSEIAKLSGKYVHENGWVKIDQEMNLESPNGKLRIVSARVDNPNNVGWRTITPKTVGFKVATQEKHEETKLALKLSQVSNILVGVKSHQQVQFPYGFWSGLLTCFWSVKSCEQSVNVRIPLRNSFWFVNRAILVREQPINMKIPFWSLFWSAEIRGTYNDKVRLFSDNEFQRSVGMVSSKYIISEQEETCAEGSITTLNRENRSECLILQRYSNYSNSGVNDETAIKGNSAGRWSAGGRATTTIVDGVRKGVNCANADKSLPTNKIAVTTLWKGSNQTKTKGDKTESHISQNFVTNKFDTESKSLPLQMALSYLQLSERAMLRGRPFPLQFQPFAITTIDMGGAIPMTQHECMRGPDPEDNVTKLVDGAMLRTLRSLNLGSLADLEDMDEYQPVKDFRKSRLELDEEYAYLMTFICLETKAVHIEVIQDLDATSCFLAMSSFIKERGVPRRFLSDGGKDFVGPAADVYKIKNLLTRCGSEPCIMQNLAARFNVAWSTMPPYSVHFGERFESGLNQAKMQLHHLFSESNLSVPELMTLTRRIATLLNKRPLRPASDNPCDISVVSPSDWLSPSERMDNFTPIECDYDIEDERWKFLCELVEKWWNSWTKNHLRNLMPEARRKSNKLQVGDLVLITEDLVEGTEWPVGRITDIYEGADRPVLYAKLLTKNKEYPEWSLVTSLLRLAPRN